MSTRTDRRRARREREARTEAAGQEYDEETLEEKQEAYTEKINEVVRAGAYSGIPILSMMEGDLEEAWVKYLGKVDPDSSTGYTLRGRIRGLAQAVATVRSPYSRTAIGGDSDKWSRIILRVEADGRARAVARRRKESS